MPFFRDDPPPPRGPERPLTPAEYWSLDRPLLRFAPDDPWTIRDACEGVQVFGAPGSGKTSGPGAAIARSFLAHGFGGVVLTAKPGERELWERYCRETGRTKDLRIFSPDHPWRFNFMDYEYRQPGGGAGLTENLIALFSTVLEIAERKQEAKEQAYWKRTLNQLLRNAIDLAIMSRDRVTLPDLAEIIASAPLSFEQLASESWRQQSACVRLLEEAEERVAGTDLDDDLEATSRYWLAEYPGLSEKTRSIIVSSFTSMADGFLRGTMRKLFSTETNITPDETQHGAIIVLDLPVKVYHEMGQFAQVLFKYMWQRSTDRRDLSNPRPVFLWADESQFFVTSGDATFQSTSREPRGITVYLTQSLPNYYAACSGDGGKNAVEALLGCLQTKLFCCNSDNVTNTWAADLIAKAPQSRKSRGTNLGGKDKPTITVTTNPTVDYEVLQREFAMLKKGGPANGFMVEAIVQQTGRVWNRTARTYQRVLFRQSN